MVAFLRTCSDCTPTPRGCPSRNQVRSVGGKEMEVQVMVKMGGEAVKLERSRKDGGEGRRGPSGEGEGGTQW